MSQLQPGNASSLHLRSLHRPGQPLIIPNIWDLSSLHALLSLNTTSHAPVRAVATASFAVAATLGLPDAALSHGANLIRIRQLAPAVRAAGLPLTVDVQDGYGPRLASVIRDVVAAGAAGANLEDLRGGDDDEIGGSRLYGPEEQAGRLRLAMEVAAEAGSPDFVLNARCDVFNPASYASSAEMPEASELMAEAVRRGKAYLGAGATTVYYWGGAQRGLRDEEVRTLIKELGGWINVKLGSGPGALTTEQLAQMGVARITVGPELYRLAMKAIKNGAERILGGGGLHE
ncbi:phosphoenolpyruvate phosphomutase-domain-containing protein [Xylariaceae sp. FL0016]|nr:phosphoenolpyruvate phosphomutase-domain-containing protein [Xylariaceae sp. FL0016]